MQPISTTRSVYRKQTIKNYGAGVATDHGEEGGSSQREDHTKSHSGDPWNTVPELELWLQWLQADRAFHEQRMAPDYHGDLFMKQR